MLRIDRKLSVTLSYAFCGAAFVGVLLLGVLLACGNAFFPDSLLSAFLTAQKKAGIPAYVLEYLILALVLLALLLWQLFKPYKEAQKLTVK